MNKASLKSIGTSEINKKRNSMRLPETQHVAYVLRHPIVYDFLSACQKRYISKEVMLYAVAVGET